MSNRLPTRRQDVPINASFNSPSNIAWWNRIKNWVPDINKPVVLLPCSRQRPYSKSMTHNFLSAVTREPKFIKVVISEPLVIVPYEFENEIPNYNYPPEILRKNEQEYQIFVDRLHEWFEYVYNKSKRKKYYYIGGKHHLDIILKATKNLPLKIIYELPPRGIRDYAATAQILKKKILSDFIKGT